MASGKGRLLNLLGSLVLSEARVAALQDAGSGFRLVQLTDAGAASFQPGDKLQVVLPSKDVRTFTPVSWSARGDTQLLLHVHGSESPACRWVRTLAAGDVLRFVGPQRSLRLAAGPLVVVGDETSLAVAAAYAKARPGMVTAIFEVAEDLDLAPALALLDLRDALVVRRRAEPDDGPLCDAVARAMPATVGLTGSGALIYRVRAGLRARGLRDISVKTYWLAGKAGLD